MVSQQSRLHEGVDSYVCIDLTIVTLPAKIHAVRIEVASCHF